MLELRSLSKSFDGHSALSDVSFDVAEGEIVVLLGPSGSGKSTLLNLVAGLETPDAGQILWKKRDLKGVPVHRRGFGLMFQDYALFPHRDVFGNVAFGLQMEKQSPEAVRRRVAEVLELVGLSGFEHRETGGLSGGEQQRVALARALAPEPRLLMLDEPLGSLDRALRQRLMVDLGDILRRSGQTSLYVTHDQEEAFALADRIVLLATGRIAQIGRPETLYRQPASAFVARFLGLSNLLAGRVVRSGGKAWVETALGRWPAPRGAAVGPVTVLLRPDAARLDGQGAIKLKGRLKNQRFRGSSIWHEIEVDGVALGFELPVAQPLGKIGESVRLSFEPKRALQILPDEQ